MIPDMIRRILLLITALVVCPSSPRTGSYDVLALSEP
jgi:hypothetical protein